MSESDSNGRLRPSQHSITEQFAESLALVIIDHRLLTLVVSFFVVVVLGAGVLKTSFAPDARVFFGKDNPERVALDEMETTYAKTNNVFFVIAPRDRNLFSKNALTVLRQMTEEAWQIPYTLRVNSISNFSYTHSLGDDIIVEPLYTENTVLDAAAVARLREIVLTEPELVNLMVSPKGDVAGISVVVVLPDDKKTAVPETANIARQMAERWRSQYPGIEVRITGGVIADMTFGEAGRQDLRTLIPATAVLIFLSLAIGLRSVAATISIVVLVACAVLGAIGLAGWLGVAINAATGSSPVSIMVLVIASCVHLILTWRQAQVRGNDGSSALVKSVRVNFAPISATNITTALGFLCMNFSISPPLRDMGNIVAFGVMLGWILSLTLLPALISYMPDKRHVRLRISPDLMKSLANFVIRHRNIVLIIAMVLLPVAGMGVSRVVLDDDYIRYFDRGFDFRVDAEFAEARLTGLNVIQYSLNAGGSGKIFEPEFLNKVDAFGRWFEQQDNVVYVATVAKLLKRLNKSMNGDDPSAYEIAPTREYNAQNMLFYEMSLPQGHDLNDFVDIDRARTKVTAIVRNVSSRDIRLLGEAGQQWLHDNAPELTTPATGLSVVFANISSRNIHSMIIGTVVALLLISVILFVAFRSVKYSLVSLVPNLAPAFFAFGIWGYTFVEVNLAASVVSAMTLGIVVDDTIHITMKYLRARRWNNFSPPEAIRQTFKSVGTAVIITSFAIVAGFMMMATSGFQLSQHLAILTVLVVFIALIADLTLLPSLLLIVDRDNS